MPVQPLSCVPQLSWTLRGFDEDAVVGWRLSVSFREKTGAWKIHLAEAHTRVHTPVKALRRYVVLSRPPLRLFLGLR